MRIEALSPLFLGADFFWDSRHISEVIDATLTPKLIVENKMQFEDRVDLEAEQKRRAAFILEFLAGAGASNYTMVEIRNFLALWLYPDGLNITEMAKVTGHQRSSVRQYIQPWLENGWVKKVGNRYLLTEAGEKAREKMRTKVIGGLTPECKKSLVLIGKSAIYSL